MFSKKWISSEEFFNDFVDRFGTNYLTPFIPNALFLYPLKTSENLKIFLCFLGVEKGAFGTNELKMDFFEGIFEEFCWHISK